MMKAVVLYGIGDLRYEELAQPQPGPGEVLVRVGACGICGSDIPRVFVKGTYRFPLVIGHEFAGTVVAAGAGADDLAAGSPVAVFPLLWCGRCAACEQGRYVQCSDYDYLGSRSNGALAEYVVVPRRNLVRLPAGVTLELAAMTEPAAVALHALRRGGGTGPGETVAVFGAGPIGVMAAQWARSMGAARVMLFDVVPEKVEMARRLGFEFTFLSRERDPVQVVTEHTSGTGAGLCVEAAGVPVTLSQALAAAGRGGRVVLMGNPAKEVSLPAGLLSQFMRREVTLYGTWNSEYSACGNRDDWTTAIEAMGHGRLDLAPLVTHRVPLDQAAAALRMLRDGREFAAKVLVLP